MASQNFVTRPGSQFIQSGAGAVERTVDDKLRDVVSVKDFGAVGDGNADDTAAIQAAVNFIANERNGFGVIVLDGKFKVSSTITVSCWNLTLKGGSGSGEQGVINMTAAARVFDVTLTNAIGKLTVQNLSVNPLSNAGAAPSFIRLTVPPIASNPYSNLLAEDITVTNQSGTTGESKTFEAVFELIEAWQPRIYNCFYFARTLQPAVAGKGCMVKLVGRCLDMTLTNCLQQNGHAIVYQESYSEGINLLNCTVVASDYVINQSGSVTANATTGLKLLQVMATACEFNTHLGGYKLDKVKLLHSSGCSYTRQANSGALGWTAVDLLDGQSTSSIGDIFTAGGGGGTITAIKLRYGTRSCDHNRFAAATFEPGFNYIVDIGANVLATNVSGNANYANPFAVMLDSGSGTTFNLNGSTKASAGSLANPSLGFAYTADGFYQPSANATAYTSQGTQRMLFTAGGFFKAANDGSYQSATDGYHELRSSGPSRVLIIGATNASYAEGALTVNITRAASSAFKMLEAYSGAFGDREYELRGDGNAFADGSWTGGGADYAEYFEWADGNENAQDRRGISVVLDGDKIRPALMGETPVGVISGNPSIVGDAAWNKWSGKYLRDEYGTYILEDYEAEDEDGSMVVQQRRKLNPDYDESMEYTSREDRPEWDVVGLMGKLRIRKGQPVAPNWIKMKDVSDTVEEWLIR